MIAFYSFHQTIHPQTHQRASSSDGSSKWPWISDVVKLRLRSSLREIVPAQHCSNKVSRPARALASEGWSVTDRSTCRVDIPKDANMRYHVSNDANSQKHTQDIKLTGSHHVETVVLMSRDEAGKPALVSPKANTLWYDSFADSDSVSSR